MARYCTKCGKHLPDGVESCPECGGSVREDGAALFTRISAETEGWKEEPHKKIRPKRTRTQQQTAAYTAAAVAVVALAICLILYIQPVNRLKRALERGEYDRAVEIYWSNSSLAEGKQDDELTQPLLDAASSVRDAYARHEIQADDAATTLGKLGTFGSGAEELLSPIYAEFRAMTSSQDHMEKADKFTKSGDYLAAREEYLLVSDEDSAYAEAQEKADTSLDRFADSVLSEADVYIQTGDYTSAMAVLESGRQTLLGYEVYNAKLENKLEGTYALFEENLLTRAQALASQGDYQAAAQLLEDNMVRASYETEHLREIQETYAVSAHEKSAASAAAEAVRLYDAGNCETAFSLLEEMIDKPDANREAIAGTISELEQRFVQDAIREANALFDGKRENLTAALQSLNEALRIRRLPDIEIYRAQLSLYLPLKLSETEYVKKEGTLLRSMSTFDALNGNSYGEGWVWGENGAEVYFDLEGQYDRLEGILVTRGDDETVTEGSLEIWCDGELAWRSETLQHPTSESITVSVQISGCNELMLRFVNNYAIRAAEGGYCYHGFCSPIAIKDLAHAQELPLPDETNTASNEAGIISSPGQAEAPQTAVPSSAASHASVSGEDAANSGE